MIKTVCAGELTPVGCNGTGHWVGREPPQDPLVPHSLDAAESPSPLAAETWMQEASSRELPRACCGPFTPQNINPANA